MKRGLLYKYLIPSEINYVMLRPLNVYGWMESGKTTLSLKIASRIEEEVGDKYGFLCVLGRRQSDVLGYLEENRDIVKGNSYIVMIYDDAGRHYMSRGESARKERREELKDFLELRHIFEGFGMDKGVVIPVFNIQYYNLLDKTLRNVPASAWKTLVLMDRGERREFILNIGWKYYYFLKTITKAMYIGDYVLTRSAVQLKGVRGEQVYTWLYEFFKSRGAPEFEAGILLKRDFVKRFGLVVLLDERMVVDFGLDIRKPKNLVEVKPKENEDWWMPTSQDEKKRILWWVVYLGVRFGLDEESVRDLIREGGLSFGNDLFSSLWSELKLMYNNDRKRKRRRRKGEKGRVVKEIVLADILNST